MTKVIISLSGGLDSSTLLALLLHQKHEVEAVVFRYPSNHNDIEVESAEKIAKHYNIPYRVLDVSGLFVTNGKLVLLGGVVPKGHYTSENMKATVVPGRNLIFATILASIAESIDFDAVALGTHAGDHAIYPDCRPHFNSALGRTLYESTEGRVTLITPFEQLTKTEIVKIGLDLGVPYELTRTCYTDKEEACGECGSCVERLEAFSENKSLDTIKYRKL